MNHESSIRALSCEIIVTAKTTPAGRRQLKEDRCSCCFWRTRVSEALKIMSSWYLILSIVSLLSSLAHSAEWLDCGSPKSFEVELNNNQRAFVYDAEIKIKYDRNELAVYEYPGLDAVNILINNTIIDFSGHILPENQELDPNAFKTSKIYLSKIAGSARVMKSGSKDVLTDCSLFLSRNRNEEESNISKKIQVEILHEAVTCAKQSLCQRLGSISLDDLRRGKKNPFEFGSLSVLASGFLRPKESRSEGKPKINANDVKALLTAYSSNNTNTNDNSVDREGLQSAINKLVDIAVAELVKKIKEENQGKIKIPDLSQNFSTGSSWWETTGEFNAYDGTFEDLTTLSRTEDASLSHTGLKFVAGCGFGLSRAVMDYQKYRLRYGIIKVNGKLSASVDGVSLYAAVGVDYNQKPCKTVLQTLRVSDVGKIKVKVTGLGPLNKLLSKLVTWITKKWQEEIVGQIEAKLREYVLIHLNKFNCERYRP